MKLSKIFVIAGVNADNFCSDKGSGMFAHKECAKFYHCAHGRTFIKNCGHGTVFDPKLQICNWPHTVVCPIKTTTTTTTTTTTKATTVNIKQQIQREMLFDRLGIILNKASF
ncbi:unnamed protein product [Oikopleura dioica]|uniref:chitinase n=1 Tax=Oikopleura dioica TaxID=34765 RepID=E4Y4I7_OIKDI|nr:unnamed protein product [Oikopleura dioica]